MRNTGGQVLTTLLGTKARSRQMEPVEFTKYGADFVLRQSSLPAELGEILGPDTMGVSIAGT